MKEPGLLTEIFAITVNQFLTLLNDQPMKVRYLNEALAVGSTVKLLVQTHDGDFDLLRGEVVAVFPDDQERYKYRILGETNQQKDVVAHAFHTDDTLIQFFPLVTTDLVPQ